MKGSLTDAVRRLLPPRRRKWVFWILGLVTFYAVLGFLILPPIIRAVAVKVLSKQLDREVSIRQIKLNPFALSVAVDGLLIKDKDGQPFVSWDEVYVNLQASSFFGKAWVFDEISTVRPFVRAQMNADGTFNFSDLITKFAGTNTPAPVAPPPAKPLIVHVRRLRIVGASAAVADFTSRTPFHRLIGPLNLALVDFSTDPDNKNPYAFSGTTDAGEHIAWRGFFFLDPLRSQGELTLNNLSINKYSALYQDLVKFQVRDGVVGLHATYKFEYSSTNHSATVTSADFALQDFKLGAPGDTNNLVELPFFTVLGASADLQSRHASVREVVVKGATLSLSRARDASINLVELSKPADTNAAPPGGILFLLRSVTNAVSLLLNSTNQWAGAVESVDVTNCALHLADFTPARPASLDLTDIALAAKNLSNLPDTNLTATLSLHWNTNGSVKVNVIASLIPTTADIGLDLDRLNLGTLDPYLEPKLDLFILGSQVGLHGHVRLQTAPGGLPGVTFDGDAALDDFHTVDGLSGEDLLKWDGVHINGLHANLNPPVVTIRQIAVLGAQARLVIETNGTINLLNVLRLTNAPAVKPAGATAQAGKSKKTSRTAAGTATLAATPAATAATPALPEFAVDEIVISNTTASFTDRSIAPPVHLAIEQVNGSIAGISSKQLQHAVVDLNAKIDGVGPVAITGVINPFNPAMTNTIKITVNDMDLTPASPYSGKFAGYRIAEGKLDLDLAYNLVGRKLSSKNVITLDQFTFGDHVDSPQATHLPVRLAIAILKDRQGKIVLDVPIEGSLDDPKFRISKVVIYAIENILEKVATSPFSLIGALIGGGGPELAYQDFAPGGADLSAADRQKLDSLAKALYERPALKLEITGSIDPDGDREGLQRAALDRLIRQRIWQQQRQTGTATNTADQVTLTPELRAQWVQTIYGEDIKGGVITPALVAANTNLAAFASVVSNSVAAATQPKGMVKGATLLMTLNSPPLQKAAAAAAAVGPAYHTKLVPPPTPEEAILLSLFPVAPGDLEILAARRAQAVQAYFLQTGKVTADRLFLTQKNGPVRSDGSRVYLQFR